MIKLKNIILLLFILSGFNVKAQVVPSTGFETDARTVGFGGAGVALDANAFSLYRNTAAISFADSTRKMAASYGYNSLFNDAQMHTLGGYYRLNRNHAFAGGVRYYAADKIRNTEDGLTYTTVKPYDLLIDLAYARRVTNNLSLSANFRYIFSKLNEGKGIENGNSLALDLGLHYRKDAYTIAVSAHNLGMLIDYGSDEYRMPANVKLGGAYRYTPIEDHQITGSIEGRYNFLPSDYTFFSGGVGLEYMFRKMVAVRGGYHLATENRSTGNYGSVGCGVYIGPIVADFAYMLTDKKSIMKDLWCLTAGIRF